MKTPNQFAGKDGSGIAAILLLACLVAAQCFANDAAPGASSRRLSQLIDSAPYSPKDKEVLKTGLVIKTSDGATAERIPAKLIHTQVKNTTRDLPASITFLFDVAKCLEQDRLDLLNSAEVASLAAEDRERLGYDLEMSIAEYSAGTLEALLAHHGRNVRVPDDVPRSVTNPDYRQLLTLTARTLQRTRTDFRAPTHHTVQNGDSLAIIARKYGISPEVLVAANPGLKPGQMRVGHIVYIPSPKPQPTPASPMPAEQVSQRRAAK